MACLALASLQSEAWLPPVLGSLFTSSKRPPDPLAAYLAMDAVAQRPVVRSMPQAEQPRRHAVRNIAIVMAAVRSRRWSCYVGVRWQHTWWSRAWRKGKRSRLRLLLMTLVKRSDDFGIAQVERTSPVFEIILSIAKHRIEQSLFPASKWRGGH